MFLFLKIINGFSILFFFLNEINVVDKNKYGNVIVIFVIKINILKNVLVFFLFIDISNIIIIIIIVWIIIVFIGILFLFILVIFFGYNLVGVFFINCLSGVYDNVKNVFVKDKNIDKFINLVI